MGDRYTIYKMKCAYCKEWNEDIYYAPSSGAITFTCDHCKKENDIVMEFRAEKIK